MFEQAATAMFFYSFLLIASQLADPVEDFAQHKGQESRGPSVGGAGPPPREAQGVCGESRATSLLHFSCSTSPSLTSFCRVRAERASAVRPHRLRGHRRPLFRHPRQHGVHCTAGTPPNSQVSCAGAELLLRL